MKKRTAVDVPEDEKGGLIPRQPVPSELRQDDVRNRTWAEIAHPCKMHGKPDEHCSIWQRRNETGLAGCKTCLLDDLIANSKWLLEASG